MKAKNDLIISIQNPYLRVLELSWQFSSIHHTKKMLKKINPKFLTISGIVLISVSILLFLGIFVISFLEIPLAKKGMIVSALFISGEITWWLGVVLLGKQVYAKYKKHFNPANWFGSKADNEEKGIRDTGDEKPL